MLLVTCAAGAQQIHESYGTNGLEVEVVAENVVRVHVVPQGPGSARTLVLDPQFQPVRGAARLTTKDGTKTLSSGKLSVALVGGAKPSIEVRDSAGTILLTIANVISEAHGGNITMVHDEREPLYGMRGLDRPDTGAGILRTGGATVAAGVQGDGGAPFFFTTKYGVLIDSDGGSFEPRDETLRFRHNSRPDAEFFVIVGDPHAVMDGLSRLTGRQPMPPRWTLGFLNSQWVSTETEILGLAKTYREKQIPISGFILDFDWKAWGEDNYGEWRWNSTSGAGNSNPDKFPDGASGKFGADLLGQGIHLSGILKPRILVNREDGKPTEASAYATAHNLWYPNENRDMDYFTHRLAGNIDFSNAEARTWYWQHLIPAFQTGMTAWWNDEADYSNKTIFNNFQFLNMGRALYEGQRATSPERVWSINRAYYLGAARYGYAEWSGDIATGFQQMEYQRRRMIAALDIGEPHWSMDTGGFDGHPGAENYARWMEFAAFVPIDRVHGNYMEKRQPWVYGPVAEAAAKRAMRMRYDLMPYLYSNERAATEMGVGLVRPLFWEFPDDPKCANETRSWMFGDALLVSPIVERGATSHALYLPAGRWFDYASGKPMEGGREVSVTADAVTWADIPLFVREGSILATQDSGVWNDVNSKAPLVLDLFPSAARTAAFTVYDDDGHTYGYEKGEFFRQLIAVKARGSETVVDLQARSGTYRTTIPTYVLRVHRGAANVDGGGIKLRVFGSEAAFTDSQEPGWVTTTDRFGPVTLVRLSASGAAGTVTLR